TNLPAPSPLEFEVAAIKPAMAASDAPIIGAPSGFEFQSNGRVDAQGQTLRALILTAWGFNTDELLVGPKSLDTTKWEVVAKARTVAASRPDQVATEALRLMLRNLLVDRFQLKTHFEDRPVSAYTLVAASPKLQKADPLGRTGCKENPPPNPIRSRLVTCTNM